jgi:hypothetical protein
VTGVAPLLIFGLAAWWWVNGVPEKWYKPNAGTPEHGDPI